MRAAARVTAAGLLLAGTTACGLLEGEEQAAPAPPTPVTEVPFTDFADFTDLYAAESSGVVRIASVSCEGGGSGSGFLVDPDEVVTAAHVVDEAVSLSVRAGDQVRGAEVLRLDRRNDVALLRLDAPVAGHVFTWSDTPAEVGEDVAVIGYPAGRPLAMTKGAVTAVDRRVAVADGELTGAVQTDAAVNPGNSGGPLVSLEGTVEGIVVASFSEAQNDSYVVPASIAEAALVAGDDTGRASTASCDEADAERADDGPAFTVEVLADHPEAPSLAQTFQLHGDAINRGRYGIAFGLLTPSVRGSIGAIDDYAAQLESSYWRSFELIDVRVVDETTDDVEVRFRTVQDAEWGPDGQTCSDWHVRYRMVLDAGFWQIDRAKRITPPTACVDAAVAEEGSGHEGDDEGSGEESSGEENSGEETDPPTEAPDAG